MHELDPKAKNLQRTGIAWQFLAYTEMHQFICNVPGWFLDALGQT